jgi:hypothetical protein
LSLPCDVCDHRIKNTPFGRPPSASSAAFDDNKPLHKQKKKKKKKRKKKGKKNLKFDSFLIFCRCRVRVVEGLRVPIEQEFDEFGRIAMILHLI